MTNTDKLYLQQICGKFLYYGRAIDDTMLHALNGLASQQTNGTDQTIKAMLHFLNYAATLPDAKKVYKASDMILYIDSDTVYLVAPQAQSRDGGFHGISGQRPRTPRRCCPVYSTKPDKARLIPGGK